MGGTKSLNRSWMSDIDVDCGSIVDGCKGVQHSYLLWLLWVYVYGYGDAAIELIATKLSYGRAD